MPCKALVSVSLVALPVGERKRIKQCDIAPDSDEPCLHRTNRATSSLIQISNTLAIKEELLSSIVNERLMLGFKHLFLLLITCCYYCLNSHPS